jgi:carboxymethylenebutenolidase
VTGITVEQQRSADMGRDVTIAASDGGRFGAYVAAPRESRAPGLVLIQYICGVNRMMRGLADEFAGRGFRVAVPDLFWRQEPGVQLNNDPSRPTEAEQKRALALNAGFDDDKGVADLIATLDWLRAAPGATRKVGVLGYCLGGRLAYLMAARADADCAVGYYGVNIEGHLGEAGSIGRPLMLHIADRDELCAEPARRQIADRLAAVPGAVVHNYPGAGHAFALRGGHNFNPSAAAEADRRSLDFLNRHLAGDRA